MTFTAQQIAMMIGGQVEGDNLATVASFGKIEEARGGQLAFLANPKYEEYLYNTRASVVIIGQTQELRQAVGATLIRVADPYSAFAALLAKYQELQAQQLVGIQQPSFIDPSAKIGNNVFIGAFAYVGKNAVVADGAKIYPQVFLGNDVHVGENARLMPGVKVYHECKIGRNVTVHAGSVIGADGFGFAPQADGSFTKVPQIGNVIVEDNVEIGANACIDRATIGSTVIRNGAKLDNLVQIAHNVEVGSNSALAAQAGVSGSTKIGNYVIIGGQAGLAGHLTVGDGAKINAQAGLGKSLKPGQSVTGSPAYDYNTAIRAQATARNLPDIVKRLELLEKKLAALQNPV